MPYDSMSIALSDTKMRNVGMGVYIKMYSANYTREKLADSVI